MCVFYGACGIFIFIPNTALIRSTAHWDFIVGQASQIIQFNDMYFWQNCAVLYYNRNELKQFGLRY